VEIQQSRRPPNDGSTQKARRSNEKRAQTGNNAIGRAQVGRTLAAAIQDQKLMPHQHGFGNHTAETARLCQLNQSGDQMNEEDDEILPGLQFELRLTASTSRFLFWATPLFNGGYPAIAWIVRSAT
jgi:hypothetical protein